jgi:hypothetical protein
MPRSFLCPVFYDRYIFAKLLVTIPSYIYILDGYFGVGKGHPRNPLPGTHKGDPRIQEGKKIKFSVCRVCVCVCVCVNEISTLIFFVRMLSDTALLDGINRQH